MSPNLPDEIVAEFLAPALKISETDFADTSLTSPFATFGESTSALLVVCKSWLRVATPLLYNTVVIRSRAQAVALQKALQGNAELGPFVKKLRVEGGFGAPMRGILQHATKITDLLLFVCVWSNDATAGLCAGLGCINPTRLIIHDPDEPPINKQSRELVQKIADCVQTWTNLKIVETPYPIETLQNPGRSRLLYTGILASPSLEEFRGQTPYSNDDNIAMDVLQALARCPNMKRIVLSDYLPDDSESAELAKLIQADEKLKGMVDLRIPGDWDTSSKQLLYTKPPHEDFIPFSGVPDAIQDQIWGRVLFFAMSIPEIDDFHAGDIYHRTADDEMNADYLLPSDNFYFILVCKRWKTVGIRHLYRHIKLSEPGNIPLLAASLQHPTNAHLNLAAEIHSISIGQDGVFDDYPSYDLHFGDEDQQPFEGCENALVALEVVLRLAVNLQALDNGGVLLYPPAGPIEEEIPVVGWNVFESIPKTLQTLCSVRFGAAASPRSPLVLESFSNLRALEWFCMTEFCMPPGKQWAKDALPRLECLSVVKWHPLFLATLADAELPSLRRVYFLVDMSAPQNSTARAFLAKHHTKLTQLRVNVADRGDPCVLELCTELPLLIYGNGDPTVDDDDEMARLEQPTLSVFRPKPAHSKLEKLILCLPISADKEVKNILRCISLHYLPALKTIQISNECWPTNEREISKSKIIPSVEALLRDGVTTLDGHGVPWRARLKRRS
ncbi:hypothetical protein MKEN_00034600 [Mycena kentingensis (nom. inval.)]|nr:hypothetical protein MKEN_00034600 [Mycena kentingensis (nom. inval.)]